jgi:uncharacterized RDD family membrane protein YckC
VRLAEDEAQLKLAPLGDRFLAFCSDAAFYCLIYAGLLRLGSGGRPWSLFLRAEWKLLGVVVLLWTFFEAVKRGNSGGLRRCGLAVVDAEGRGLGLGRALARAALLPVSVFGGLGALWAYGDPLNRGWHDFAGGSLVVEDPEGAGRRAIGRLWGVTGLMVLLAFCWWRGSIPSFRRVVLVEAAQVGVGEISRLERAYFKKNGRFTDSLAELAPLSSDPAKLRADWKLLFADDAPIKISAWNNGYSVSATARDPKRTIVEIHGP